MQKLSVLLLAVTAGMMVPFQTVSALEGQVQGMIRRDVEAVIATEQGATTELPVLNVLDERLIVQSINPREGVIDLEVTSPTGKEWQIKQIWFAAFDYENGWTEVEVDKMLNGWAEPEAEWTKIVKEQPLENMSLRAYATVVMTIGESKLQYDLTTVNLSDVLYYAAEFEDLRGEEEGPIWVRGKIDYRGCVHAKSFLEGETDTCSAQVDRQNGTVKYWLSGALDDEEVVTWEEEWRLVLTGRLTEVETALDELVPEELSPATLEWALEQQEEELADIEKLLTKATGVSEEIETAKGLRAKIATLRNWETDDSSSSSDAGSSSSSDTSLGGGYIDSGVSVGVEADSGGVKAEDNSGESGSKAEVAGRTEFVNEAMISGAVAPAFEGEASEGINIGVSVPVEDAGGADDSTVDAEIPKLGGAKAEKGWVWWVVGGAAALSLLLAAVLKRKQGKDGQR